LMTAFLLEEWKKEKINGKQFVGSTLYQHLWWWNYLITV
jgi:hypothetical protein